MNWLRREISPLSEKVWKAVDETAVGMAKQTLVGRRIADDDGAQPTIPVEDGEVLERHILSAIVDEQPGPNAGAAAVDAGLSAVAAIRGHREARGANDIQGLRRTLIFSIECSRASFDLLDFVQGVLMLLICNRELEGGVGILHFKPVVAGGWTGT